MIEIAPRPWVPIPGYVNRCLRHRGDSGWVGFLVLASPGKARSYHDRCLRHASIRMDQRSPVPTLGGDRPAYRDRRSTRSHPMTIDATSKTSINVAQGSALGYIVRFGDK